MWVGDAWDFFILHLVYLQGESPKQDMGRCLLVFCCSTISMDTSQKQTIIAELKRNQLGLVTAWQNYIERVIPT